MAKCWLGVGVLGCGLVKGKRIAMMQSWRRMRRCADCAANGGKLEEFLRGLAKASGIETLSEKTWHGWTQRKKRTSIRRESGGWGCAVAKRRRADALAHKAEHAVDLDTGAVVAVTLQGADWATR